MPLITLSSNAASLASNLHETGRSHPTKYFAKYSKFAKKAAFCVEANFAHKKSGGGVCSHSKDRWRQQYVFVSPISYAKPAVLVVFHARQPKCSALGFEVVDFS